MKIEILHIVLFVVGLFIGVLIAWLIMRSRAKLVIFNETTHNLKEKNTLRQKNEFLCDENAELQEQRHNQENILIKISDENKTLTTHFEVCKQKFKDLKKHYEESQNKISHLKSELEFFSTENISFKEKIAELSTLNKQQKLAAHEKLTLLNESRVEMTNQFKSLAHDIFEEKNKQFSDTSKERLDNILNPFNKQLNEFKNTVKDVYVNEAKQRASLKTEIKGLKDLNHQLNKEAINLTKALKGDKKLQGNWGELILERVLEQSGLRKDFEYEAQGGFRDADNNILKPDVIIHLPQGKDIIVDSKVSLVAYEKYSSASDEEQSMLLKEHIKAIENHIKALSEKDYSSLKGIKSLDFVLMFIPIEPAFMVAFQDNEKLFSDAFNSKIIVVTPTTLLATLKTIENLWRYEKQNQNARIIAERAGIIYDKFRGFIEDIEKLGKQLDTTQNTYHDALNKLNKGKGNLVNQAQQLLNLGVKVKKEIPKSLLKNIDLD
ncbi:MAG: DNA recombination protein RmuC [Marinicellaceae bacterium]